MQAGRIAGGDVIEEIGLVPENYLALLERDEALWEEPAAGVPGP